jgi:antitoxin ParD1/3/4
MNISLPESMKQWVDTQVESGGYGTASEYIRELLRREQKKAVRAEINASLLDVIHNDKFEPMPANEWEDIKREGDKIIAARKRKRA